MGWFFVSGQSQQDGQNQTIRVQASSASEALQKATEKGLSDPVLETDEVSALVTAGPDQDVFSDEEMLQIRQMTGLQNYLWLVWLLLKQVWMPLAGVAAYLILQSFTDGAWGLFDWSVAALGGLLIAFVFLTPFLPTPERKIKRLYDQLIHASVVADWPEVIRCADELAPLGVTESELAFRRANAMAHLGQVDEALAHVRPWTSGLRDDEQCPRAVALGRASEILDVAGRFEEANAFTEQALELMPDSPVMMLDTAMRRARNGNTEGAEALLDQLEEATMSRELEPMHQLLIAMVANNRGKHRHCLEALDPVYAHCKHMVKVVEIWRLVMISFDVEYAIAYHNLGDRETAQKFYRRAEKLIEAHDSKQTRDRYRNLTGQRSP